MKLRLVILLTLLIFFIVNINGQDLKSPGVISGNIQTIGQYYQEDSIINAALPEHLYGFNGFANVNSKA